MENRTEAAEPRQTPWTVAESSALPQETKDTMLRQAKPGTWYDGWHPYCGTCSTMHRMHQEAYGFRCGSCGNMIAWDLTRLVESPLNRRKEAAPKSVRHATDFGYTTTALGSLTDGNVHGTVVLGGISDGNPYLPRFLKLHGGEELPIYGHSKLPDLVRQALQHGQTIDIGLNSPQEPRTYCSEHIPKSSCDWNPEEREDHSRISYPTAGPTGHPTKHRRNRKQQKQSRKRNRRR